MSPETTQDAFLSLFAPEPEPPEHAEESQPWKVLLVDDEEDIHAALRLHLQHIRIQGAPLRLFDARSAESAKVLLREHPDMALILLDVVMESGQAGLELVRYIREACGNRTLRIILVTGQPGYAPRHEVVADYEIDGYQLKTELTADRVFSLACTSLRTFKALRDLMIERERLQRTSSDLDAIFRSLPYLVSLHGRDGRYLRVNPTLVQEFGFDPTGLSREEVARRVKAHFPDGQPLTHENMPSSRALAGETVYNYEYLITDAQGTERTLLVNAIPLVSGVELQGVVLAQTDVTDRKLAEVALRESEERYRHITEGLRDYQYRVRVDQGRAVETVHWQGCETVTGYTAKEFASNPNLWFEMIAVEDRHAARAHFDQVLQGRKTTPFEHRIHRKDGSVRWVSDTTILNRDPGDGRLLSYDGIVSDITERKQAEEERAKLQAQLLQAQKMESLGSLAGGVAHDMNNVLAAILGLASAHLEIQPEGSPAHRAFDTIAKAATRGGKMVKTLLSFARQSTAEERELDLNTMLREELQLLERTTPPQITIHLDLASDLGTVHGDAGALTNAFMNLCVNAVDAMAGTGTLTLRTRNVDKDWVEIQVEDTGAGMPKEVLEKAFDPFFTTKAQGKGTGLGLSIVYSTVKVHKGLIEIHSEPGHGTCVIMRFPSSTPMAMEAEPQADPPTRPTPTHSLKVLLVDDDELIQASMRVTLDMLGHANTTVSSGEEALAKLEAGYQPDVVVLDMNMPGLGGAGTLPLLRAKLPYVPVLLATGRADQTALSLVQAHPGVTLLSKPYSLGELKQHLESVEGRQIGRH